MTTPSTASADIEVDFSSKVIEKAEDILDILSFFRYGLEQKPNLINHKGDRPGHGQLEESRNKHPFGASGFPPDGGHGSHARDLEQAKYHQAESIELAESS